MSGCIKNESDRQQILYNFGKSDEKSFSLRDTRFPPGARLASHLLNATGESPPTASGESPPDKVGETRQQKFIRIMNLANHPGRNDDDWPWGIDPKLRY